MNKKLIITLSVIAIIIIIFVLFANPLPKKEPEKSFTEILDTIKNIDIIINAPYDAGEHKVSKTIDNKEEIESITFLLKEAIITEEIDIGEDFDSERFYYTLILKDEKEKNTQNIYFQKDKISINGKISTINSENIQQIDHYITENFPGFGTLKCEKETPNTSTVEKYYFQNNKIYHLSESKTYTPDNIKEKDDNISKINSYAGVSAMGNIIGETKYSYRIDIDTNIISKENYKEITNKDIKDITTKTKDDIEKEKKDMKCSFTFLDY